MTTRVSTFPLRLPVSLKAALEKISERDGTSLNQFLVIAAAEKIAAMETERFFEERKNRADRKAFRADLESERRRAAPSRRRNRMSPGMRQDWVIDGSAVIRPASTRF